MRIRCLIVLQLALLLFSLSCSQEKKEDQDIIAKINDYNLTIDEYKYQLREAMECEEQTELTNKFKIDFLEELIKKEILIQEAIKLDLDKKEKFIKSIERYWESTLIRNFMDIKNEEINQTMLVSKNEIDTYYKKLKESKDTIPPLNKIEDSIIREIKERKNRVSFKNWISQLRKNAQVEINQEILETF